MTYCVDCEFCIPETQLFGLIKNYSYPDCGAYPDDSTVVMAKVNPKIGVIYHSCRFVRKYEETKPDCSKFIAKKK
jgi:hypothetical protein